MAQLKVGIIGAGRIGSLHAKSIAYNVPTATVVGILLHDVIADRPQGTLLKKAYINETVAEAHSGITYADGVKTALPMVVFE